MTSRPILVCTDLGETSNEAIRQAAAWARRVNAPLVACHVMPDLVRIQPLLPHLSGADAAFVPALHERVGAALAERVTKLTGRRGQELGTVLDEGPTVATLLRIAEEHQPQLLVLGSSSKEPLERALLGSTAEQVCRYAHVSVLVARRAPEASSRILVATDFSESAEPALAAAAVEADRRGVDLAIVHALDVAHPALAAFDASAVLPAVTIEALRTACNEMLTATRERLHASGPALVVEGAPAGAIAHTAKDLHASLVVVGTHGRTGLKRVALGSVAEGVIRRAPCSVLVVRAS